MGETMGDTEIAGIIEDTWPPSWGWEIHFYSNWAWSILGLAGCHISSKSKGSIGSFSDQTFLIQIFSRHTGLNVG